MISFPAADHCVQGGFPVITIFCLSYHSLCGFSNIFCAKTFPSALSSFSGVIALYVRIDLGVYGRRYVQALSMLSSWAPLYDKIFLSL